MRGGCSGATRSLPAGALVEVDGTAGEIHVLELARDDISSFPASERTGNLPQ